MVGAVKKKEKWREGRRYHLLVHNQYLSKLNRIQNTLCVSVYLGCDIKYVSYYGPQSDMFLKNISVEAL